MTKIVHALVAKTAKEIAAEFWEICSSDNTFHKHFPKVRPFVQRHWRDFVGAARHSLVKILADPLTHDNLKQPIYEAILLEGGFKATPQAPSALTQFN